MYGNWKSISISLLVFVIHFFQSGCFLKSNLCYMQFPFKIFHFAPVTLNKLANQMFCMKLCLLLQYTLYIACIYIKKTCEVIFLYRVNKSFAADLHPVKCGCTM